MFLHLQVKQVNYIKSIRRKKAFKMLIFKFERECPPPTVGLYRPKYDMVSFIKRIQASRGKQTEWIAYKMTWSAFRCWATKEDGGEMTEIEAQTEWENMKGNKKWPRDFKGRNGQLRLLVHTDEKVIGYENWQESHEIELHEEPRTAPADDNTLREMSEALTQNFGYASGSAPTSLQQGLETAGLSYGVGSFSAAENPSLDAEAPDLPLISSMLSDNPVLMHTPQKRRADNDEFGGSGDHGDGGGGGSGGGSNSGRPPCGASPREGCGGGGGSPGASTGGHGESAGDQPNGKKKRSNFISAVQQLSQGDNWATKILELTSAMRVKVR